MTQQKLPFPVQVTFHGVRHSDELEESAYGHVAHLERFHRRIHGCTVVVKKAEGASHTGRYEVQVRVAIPGNDVVAGGHHQQPRPGHEDPFLALADAFRAAERQLEDVTRVRRGDVKSHEEGGLSEGRVTRLVPEEDHGFITATDGREVYFHRRSVLAVDFDDLGVGDTVRFAEEQGEKGPQASTVHVR
jgi:cold shock CspA family protein